MTTQAPEQDPQPSAPTDLSPPADAASSVPTVGADGSSSTAAPSEPAEAPAETPLASDLEAPDAPVPAEAEAEAEAEPTPATAETAAPAAAATLSPAACAAALAERFPALFAAPTPLPIKLRIQADIQQRAPGVFSRKALSIFLHRHTTSTPYIRALLAATQRFDLDGQPAGDIAEEHRAAATEELERRRALVQARRAAQRPGPRQPGREGRPAAAGPAGNNAEPVDAQAAEGGLPAAPRQTPRNPARTQRPPRPQPGERRPPNNPDGGRGAARPPRSDQRPGPRPDQHADPRSSHRQPPQSAPETPPPSGDPAADAARRERNALLRAYESSTLTKANFLVLKRMTAAELDAQLALAQQERTAWRARSDAPAADSSGPRPPRR